MAESKLSAKARASQDIVPIEEIREGVVILKDGSFRAILMASSLNFALKSPEEQEAIILQYQNFLNSLDFSIEIVTQSRKLNIDPYLETLLARKKEETNDLLKIQITEYVTFVKEFVNTGNIVSKTFYVAVSFVPALGISTKKSGLLSGLFSGGGASGPLVEEEKFSEYKIQLFQRVDTVVDGLVRCGIRAVPLNTEELIELYYGLYNPGGSNRGGAPQLSNKVQT